MDKKDKKDKKVHEKRYSKDEDNESQGPRQDLDRKTTITEKRVTTETFRDSKSKTVEPRVGNDYLHFDLEHSSEDCPSQDKVDELDQQGNCFDVGVSIY